MKLIMYVYRMIDISIKYWEMFLQTLAEFFIEMTIKEINAWMLKMFTISGIYAAEFSEQIVQSKVDSIQSEKLVNSAFNVCDYNATDWEVILARRLVCHAL